MKYTLDTLFAQWYGARHSVIYETSGCIAKDLGALFLEAQKFAAALEITLPAHILEEAKDREFDEESA